LHKEVLASKLCLRLCLLAFDVKLAASKPFTQLAIQGLFCKAAAKLALTVGKLFAIKLQPVRLNVALSLNASLVHTDRLTTALVLVLDLRCSQVDLSRTNAILKRELLTKLSGLIRNPGSLLPKLLLRNAKLLETSRGLLGKAGVGDLPVSRVASLLKAKGPALKLGLLLKLLGPKADLGLISGLREVKASILLHETLRFLLKLRLGDAEVLQSEGPLLVQAASKLAFLCAERTVEPLALKHLLGRELLLLCLVTSLLQV
jgi:hypothetical protein